MIKNDKVLWQKSYLEKTDSRLGKDGEFLLTFSSASDPFHPNDNPRGWRHWDGTLEVVDGQLESIVAVDASFPLQTFARSTENPNRLTFFTQTRGDSSSYLIKLSEVSRTTRLKFDLVESRETGGAPPRYRPAQRIPADSFVLALKDLQEGTVAHTQTTDGYNDRTELRHINYDGPRELEFEFADEGDRQGDYYFMRVKQANDAMAWSSPIWVGGFNKK